MPKVDSYTVKGSDAQDLFDSLAELPSTAYLVNVDWEYSETRLGEPRSIYVTLRFED